MRNWSRHGSWHSALTRAVIGSLFAVAGVILITWVAQTAQAVLFPEAVALLYCFLVLCIALLYGPVAAGVAVFLALVVYWWHYISSVNRVLKGAEIGAILALAVLALWFRFRQVFDTRSKLHGLIELAELVVSTPDETDLLERLLERILRLDDGEIAGLAVIAPNEAGKLAVCAVAARGAKKDSSLLLEGSAPLAEADSAFKYRRVTVHRKGGASGRKREKHSGRATFYVPLRRDGAAIGLLAIHGRPSAEHIARALYHTEPDVTQVKFPRDDSSQQPMMLHVYAGHVAVTLERLRWRRQAVAVEALKRSDQLKDALLGNVAHNLKTPVAAMQLVIDGMFKDQEAGVIDVAPERLDDLKTGIARLARISSHALSLVSLEAGVVQPQRQWYLMGETIGHAIDLVEKAHKTPDHFITMDAPDDLPLIYMDRDQIEDVVMNLLDNAVKYSPPSAGVVVRACVIQGPRRLKVEVIDAGPGVPEASRRHVFDKFYRVQDQPGFKPLDGFASARAHTHKGTGLGLTICASIVHLHGGQIGVEGHEGPGARFWFTLPMGSEPPRHALPKE